MPKLPDDFDPKKGFVFLIDKPQKWTSFDVVNKVRYALGRGIKVGHAGTLDPLATGLLVLCCGAMTKQIDTLQAGTKTYEGILQLGATTVSYDSETPLENPKDFSLLSEEQLTLAFKQFEGKILQVPPAYSAVQIEGKRAYQLAREGKQPELKAREVEIFDLQVLDIDLPLVGFRMTCSKGTYVRSFAHDLGQKLGCGGFLSGLRRTRSGDFTIEQAWQIDELVGALKQWRHARTSQEK